MLVAQRYEIGRFQAGYRELIDRLAAGETRRGTSPPSEDRNSAAVGDLLKRAGRYGGLSERAVVHDDVGDAATAQRLEVTAVTRTLAK